METSKEALEAFKPKRGEVKDKTLDVFMSAPDSNFTQQEVAYIAHRNDPRTEQESYRKTVYLLERAGRIRKVGTRVCRHKPGRTKVTAYQLARPSKTQVGLFDGVS